MKYLYSMLLLTLAGLGPISLQAEEGLADIEPLTTRAVMELYVEIAPPVEVGPSDLGIRQFVPITGGRFTGINDLRGKVLPYGADWQLIRSDGVMQIEAHYAVQTDDGAVIEIRNQGIIAIPGGAEAREQAKREKAPDNIYFRTAPQLHAPVGKYGWLNERLYTGTVEPVADGSAVVVRFFAIE
ncbi:MAG: DUF3237 family protein [Spongiibacteraceae bacterium]|nr:DUF3237 family protein [Spongiibacteraceae bacterium]